MKKRLVKLFAFILFSGFLYFLYSCTTEKWEANAFRTQNGWGYTISKSGKIYIKQNTIPAVSEIKKFKSEEDALRVGNLVAEKLAKNTSPTVTENELKLLNIDMR